MGKVTLTLTLILTLTLTLTLTRTPTPNQAADLAREADRNRREQESAALT